MNLVNGYCNSTGHSIWIKLRYPPMMLKRPLSYRLAIGHLRTIIDMPEDPRNDDTHAMDRTMKSSYDAKRPL